MTYQRIQPFPPPGACDSLELRALASVWREKKAALEDDGAFKEFVKKMQREWAIETGIVERLYTWDRGVTEILISQGIESTVISHRAGVSQDEAEHIHALIKDHLEIVEGLFGFVKGDEPLSEFFIRGLQARFTEHQDFVEAMTEQGDRVRVALRKGEYKTLPNNPRRPDGVMHHYCPPEITQEEMGNLIRIYRESEAHYPPEVKSAWLHHRFTQIHPFQDGNGRVARALASLVFIREGLFPLVVRDFDRREYIEALETADLGDLKPLVDFFARRQKDAILKALGLEQETRRAGYADQIIGSAIELLRSRLNKEREAVSAVAAHADKLLEFAQERFQELAADLSQRLQEVTPPGKSPFHARVNAASNSSEQRHYFQRQIIETARSLDYFANLEKYRAWSRLTIATDQDFDYVVSFHGYGHGDTGILAASGFTYLKALREEAVTEDVGLRQAAMELFQFNYAEDYDSTLRRFSEWLDTSTAIALAEWSRALRMQ
ncbi:MAG: Fic family protein [Synergistaceae bacterium]|nr:Fic family protein [Synergistota bacterium]NLM71854.1 Fic family protein [Synergistaceae bacterium]